MFSDHNEIALKNNNKKSSETFKFKSMLAATHELKKKSQ